MKKTFIIIVSILICIISILFVFLRGIESEDRKIKKINMEYEQYLDKDIYGTDIATLINKAVNNNEKYNVEKDENGLYIEDDTNSIKIDIYISINQTTYSMEKIYDLGTTEFVKNFNTILFRGTVQEYHNSNGKISRILFEQVSDEEKVDESSEE